MAQAEKLIIAFLFGNEPNPLHLERLEVLTKSGKYEVHFIYWQRGETTIKLPFSSPFLPDERMWPIPLPDPRSGKLNRIFLSIKFALQLRTAIIRLRPHAVNAVNVNMLGLAAVALISGRLNKTALLYDYQDQIGERFPLPYRLALQFCLRRTDATFIHSPVFRSNLRRNKLLKLAEPVIEVNGGPLGWPKEKAPKHENSADGKPPPLIVGYFGYMRGRLQIEALIVATERVIASGRRVELHFRGTGDEAGFVNEKAKSLDFVKFSGAFDYRKEYRSIFLKADVIFAVYPQSVPNYRYHIARRFSEAMISGIPVIVAQGSYMAELAHQHEGVWPVREDSEEDIVYVITRLHDDRTLLRVNLPEDVRNSYRFEAVVPDLLSGIKAAIKGRSHA